MRIFGWDIAFRKTKAQTMSAVDSRGGWMRIVEGFTGAYQQFMRTAPQAREVASFSGVFACVTKISGDIAKLRPMLVEDRPDGTCREVEGESPYRGVLERPNHYQNRITFVMFWIASKLFHGNTYVLKERDGRGIVRKQHILDPQRVTPLVTEDGSVYYRLQSDHLAGLIDGVVVPASEIIHDLMCPLWHPLVGVSPIFACGASATMGSRIQMNSTAFFGNLSRPAGFLTVPGKLDEEDAAALKREWTKNYTGDNAGNTAVLANGLKYESMGAVSAEQAQLIEQLKWSIEDVARCFHMPAYKVGGAVPPNASVESLNQGYYSECLQVLIESLELCLKEGLALPRGYYVEFDLDGLLRMDTAALVTAEAEAVKAGIKSPDESRRRLNLPPVPGGASPYLQQQNYSLAALAKRDAKEDPFKGAPTPAVAPPTPAANDEDAKARAEKMVVDLLERIEKGFPCTT